MRNILKSGFIVAALGFLALGLSQPAAAAPQVNPSQYCSQEVEPALQSVGLPMSHSTCVTLFTGADQGNVSVCKWARDIGAIPANGYGQCVSTKDPTAVFNAIYQELLANNASAGQIDTLYEVFYTWEQVTGQTIFPFGPTTISLAAFAILLGGWVLLNRQRGKVRSAC